MPPDRCGLAVELRDPGQALTPLSSPAELYIETVATGWKMPFPFGLRLQVAPSLMDAGKNVRRWKSIFPVTSALQFALEVLLTNR